METSHLRLIQFSVIIALLSLGAVFWWNRDSTSKAGIIINAPQEDHIATTVRGYWKMDEGTGTSTTADASGNANTLTMTSMEVGDWVAGNIGPYSLDFDGSAEYLTVTDPASGVLDFVEGTSFTLTGWFNRDTFANDHTIIAKKTAQTTDTADGYIVWVDGTDDLLHFRADENGSTDAYSITSTSAFTSAGWNHFAVSWNDSATTNPVNVYVNGALDGDADQGSGTFANVGTLANSEAFRIGAESGTADNFFDGKLDDVRVYGFPLSADEVSKLYQTTAPMQVQLDSGLVGYWTFNGPDIKGSTVIDRSGKGNDVTFNSTYVHPAKGKLGQALRSDGTPWEYPYISTPNANLEMGTSDWSVALWVRLDVGDGSGIDYILGKGGVSAEGYAIYHDVGAYDSLVANVRTQAGTETYYVAPQVVNLIGSSWHHVVVTFDRDDGVWFYVDGASLGKDGISVYNGTNITNSGAGFALGGNSNSSLNIQGGYDDVRVYRRVLSAGEVAQLYSLSK